MLPVSLYHRMRQLGLYGSPQCCRRRSASVHDWLTLYPVIVPRMIRVVRCSILLTAPAWISALHFRLYGAVMIATKVLQVVEIPKELRVAVMWLNVIELTAWTGKTLIAAHFANRIVCYELLSEFAPAAAIVEPRIELRATFRPGHGFFAGAGLSLGR